MAEPSKKELAKEIDLRRELGDNGDYVQLRVLALEALTRREQTCGSCRRLKQTRDITDEYVAYCSLWELDIPNGVESCSGWQPKPEGGE